MKVSPAAAQRCRELGVLGEEAVAGMDRVGAGGARRREEAIDREVRLAARRAARCAPPRRPRRRAARRRRRRSRPRRSRAPSRAPCAARGGRSRRGWRPGPCGWAARTPPLRGSASDVKSHGWRAAWPPASTSGSDPCRAPVLRRRQSAFRHEDAPRAAEPQPRHLDLRRRVALHPTLHARHRPLRQPRPSAPTSIGWCERCGGHERSGTGIAAASTSTTTAGGRSAARATGLACSKRSSAACTSRRSPHPPDRGRRSSGATRRPVYMERHSAPRPLYPRSRFVHLVRDPRDCVLSTQDAWGNTPLRTAQEWADRVRRCRAAGAGARSGALPRAALRGPRGATCAASSPACSTSSAYRRPPTPDSSCACPRTSARRAAPTRW